MAAKRIVTIIYDASWGDYNVPSADGKVVGEYFTSDKEDAEQTAINFMYKGQDIEIVHETIGAF